MLSQIDLKRIGSQISNIRTPFAARIFALETLLLSTSAVLSGCGGDIGQEIRLRTFNAFVPASGINGNLTFALGAAPLAGNTSVAFGQFGNGARYQTVSNQSFTPNAT